MISSTPLFFALIFATSLSLLAVLALSLAQAQARISTRRAVVGSVVAAALCLGSIVLTLEVSPTSETHTAARIQAQLVTHYFVGAHDPAVSDLAMALALSRAKPAPLPRMLTVGGTPQMCFARVNDVSTFSSGGDDVTLWCGASKAPRRA